ncbi:hypothetical protein IEQ34_002680 [Dendrobium chrysotoxum]|uniref:S1-like domain-containing protein n=1 Tax=Dendrobium chrysotoxum TaxID=161865 RepID=A0AAV7HH81_DENCH|nr:hypothetical protein IEQ34_002680 [Dendrobium chrysotoxum]
MYHPVQYYDHPGRYDCINQKLIAFLNYQTNLVLLSKLMQENQAILAEFSAETNTPETTTALPTELSVDHLMTNFLEKIAPLNYQRINHRVCAGVSNLPTHILLVSGRFSTGKAIGKTISQTFWRNYAMEILTAISTVISDGRIRRSFIRILPGDRVKIEMSRYDSTRGRLIYRLRRSRGKLDPKWDLVKKVFSNGVYQLATIEDGRIIPPVNGKFHPYPRKPASFF